MRVGLRLDSEEAAVAERLLAWLKAVQGEGDLSQAASSADVAGVEVRAQVETLTDVPGV